MSEQEVQDRQFDAALKVAQAVALEYAAELTLMLADEIRREVFTKQRSSQRVIMKAKRETALQIADAIMKERLAPARQ